MTGTENQGWVSIQNAFLKLKLTKNSEVGIFERAINGNLHSYRRKKFTTAITIGKNI